MIKKQLLGGAIIALLLLNSNGVIGQGMSVNTTGVAADASAMLDVNSATQGVLVPRMAHSVIATISSPATSLMVYQTDGTPGYYYNAGTTGSPSWVLLGAQDANSNYTTNNVVEGYQTIVATGGTTTLTVSSPKQTYFTGTNTQNLKLPVASTLVLGQQFIVVNNSTGSLTVNSSGSNLVQLMNFGTTATYTCILASGTSAASWSVSYQAAAGGILTGSSYQATPSNPTGITSTTGVMMGLGATITPTKSGRVLIVISGMSANSGAFNTSVQLYYGSGSIPVNNEGFTGNAVGANGVWASSATNVPFYVNSVVAGLTLGTQYWIDLKVTTSSGSGTASVKNLSVSAIEY